MDKLEEVARALCDADGRKPDEKYHPTGDPDPKKQLFQWQRYEVEARKFMAAYLVMAAGHGVRR
jgi:hypothetical protein